MLNLSFNYYPIYVKSVEASDIESISDMLNKDSSISSMVERKSISVQKLRLRFIEYFISDDDFFLKIQYGTQIIGIIKGRINYEDLSAWISLFYVESGYRRRGIGKYVYREIEAILFNKFRINSVTVSIMHSAYDELMFWENLGFSINRIVNNFYDYYNEKIPMVKLNKKIKLIIH